MEERSRKNPRPLAVTPGPFNGSALDRDQLCLLALLALNCLTYFSHFLLGLWTSAVVTVLVLAYSMFLNQRHLLARHFSWANIFVGLLALFHLGYYLPVRAGLIEEFDFMPGVKSPSSEVAILLFSAAVLSFEAGVLSGCRRAWNRRLAQNQTQSVAKDLPSALLRVGIPMLGLSILLLVVFVIQQGGFRNIFQISYTDFNDFLWDRDSRFVQTGVQFFPVGILLTYVGLLFRSFQNREILYLRILAAAFILWFLVIGSRGTALLLFLGLLYVGHICKKPLPWKTLLLIGALAALIIPLVAVYRNVEAGDRVEALQSAAFVPLAAAVEMGQTYRTLVGFADIIWKENHPLLMGRTYLIAIPRLLPNFRLSKGEMPGGGYYRSTVWITEILDPATARAGGGLGSTGIGEPYANFGYCGVVGLFWLLGLLIGGLEQYFLLTRSYFVAALICGLFVPLNWYIRDDFYGILRQIVWSTAAIALVFWFSGTRSRGRALT